MFQEEEIVKPKQAKKRKKNVVGSDSDWPPSVFKRCMDHVKCVQKTTLALRIIR